MPIRRFRRGLARAFAVPATPAERLDRLELLVLGVVPLTADVIARDLARWLLGPTHEASVLSAKAGLGIYFLTLAAVVVAKLGEPDAGGAPGPDGRGPGGGPT